MRLKIALTFILSIFLFNATPHLWAESVWRVDWESTATLKDGKSWDAAFTTIQEGVDAAFNAGGGEVWVAEGTYENTISTTDTIVKMRDHISLYGGFIGIGIEGYENIRELRDWEKHKTIIDGENIHQCIYNYDIHNASIDGFIISHSYTAMENSSVSLLTVENCIFKDNSHQGINGYDEAWVDLGGLLYRMPAHQGENVYGSAICNDSSTVTVINCQFYNNFAKGGTGGNGVAYPAGWGGNANGGAIYNDSGTNLQLINCIFAGNKIVGGAPGYSPGGSGSSGEVAGSAIYSDWNSFTNLINCIIANNTGNCALYYFGGAYSQFNISNCVIWSNISSGVFLDNWSRRSVVYSDIQGGYSGEGNIDANPLFINPGGGDFHLQYGSPCIDTGTSVSISMDLDGNPRPADVPGVGADGTGWEYDMGAFEFQPNYASLSDTKNHILGRAPLPAFRKFYADHNGDGKIDVADLTFLLLQK